MLAQLPTAYYCRRFKQTIRNAAINFFVICKKKTVSSILHLVIVHIFVRILVIEFKLEAKTNSSVKRELMRKRGELARKRVSQKDVGSLW